MSNSDDHDDFDMKLNNPTGGGKTAEESGGRSTGNITGFTGGPMNFGGGGGGFGGGGSVIKGSFNATGNRAAVKNSVRYYQTRENERGESVERDGFSRDSDSLPREEINTRIDQADQRHEHEYRMVLSPGTDRDAENIDLREHTREVMDEYRRHVGETEWVAFEHGGEAAHTEHAHVHAVMYTDRPLTSDELNQVRDFSTERWEDARELQRDLDRHQAFDRGEFQDREQKQERSRPLDRSDPQAEISTRNPERRDDTSPSESSDSPSSSEDRERRRGRER